MAQPAQSDEFELIREHFEREVHDRRIVLGIGDDAALVEPDGTLAIATDTLVAGAHFLASIEPGRLARRAVAVNVSDMAAMGATPCWFTLALTLPSADAEWIAAFAAGLHAAAGDYGLALIGGDLTRGPLTITLAVIGRVEAGMALRRSGAAVGDDVYVTGTLGDASAGLDLLRRGGPYGSAERFLVDRFELPTPRILVGRGLRGIASAAIDVSDGLLADLGHICASSGCGAVVDIDLLPMSAQLRATFPHDAMLRAAAGGDDYELCFTAAPAQAARLAESARIDTPLRRIGRVVVGNRVECLRGGVPFELPVTGYRHF